MELPHRFLTLLVLCAALAYGALNVVPPPLAEPRGADDFDHRAAWAHLTQIATEPHPIGSAAHAKVRDTIVAHLTAIGLAPRVQRAVGVNGHSTAAGTIENIVARLDPPGRVAHQTAAVLLVCHYDSRIAAVGAGDDAAGVAALIETMRALKVGPALERPVILLITDGEEQGLLGAEAFISQHPFAREVAVVLNFEARGTSGPALLFETSPGAGQLVRAAAEVAPGLTGTSMAGAVYRTMPNDTDLSVFIEAGYAGLNFAFNQGWRHYHTRLDDPAHLDPRSLAHHGRTALALVRRLCGAQSLPGVEPDPVYFNLLPSLFLVYGTELAWALGGYLALACALLLVVYRRDAGGTFGALVRASLAALAGVALGIALAVGLARGVAHLHGGVLGVGDALRSGWYHAAIVLAAAGATLTVIGRGGPSGDAAAPASALAAAGIWSALAVATAILFVPGSYLFAWPPLLAVVALWRTARRARGPGWFELVARALVPAPAAVLLASTIVLFFESLGNATPSAGVVALLTGLAVTLAVPLLELHAHAARAGVLSLAAALVCVAAGAALTRPSPARPDQAWLAYGLDANSGDAHWLALPQKPGPWLAARLSPSPEIGPAPALLVTRALAPVAHHPAPRAVAAAPEVTVIRSSPLPDGGRRVSLRLTSPRGASLFWVVLPAPRVRAARLDGRELPKKWGNFTGRRTRFRADPAVDWTVEIAGVEPAGCTLEIDVAGPGTLPLRVTDISSGLPPSVAGEPPPETVVPFDFGLCTVVARTLAL